jgi:CRISPR-associated protein Csx17
MHTHACPGLGTRPLASYLAALGLARVIGEQADPEVRFGWGANTFTLRTTVPDLVDFLVTRYRPTPIISPWNGGSGFGEKDRNQVAVLDQILATDGDRLADYRRTIEVARQVVQLRDFDIWPKDRQVQELRNWLPDSALAWLDTAVVLTSEGAAFPPLLGTGGNDGRLDFSSNFHQRLVTVLPELGAKPATSRSWANDLLSGSGTAPLVSAAIGQYDPIAAGGPSSSIHGGADSLVNPWLFVLMVEGITWFASAPARRLGEAKGRASMPFTVYSSPDGPIPGAANEATRGELWAPVFRSVTLPHLRQIMSEARASWLGKTAETVPAMYGAVHTFGVDRGIDAFERYGFLQRNGLAFVAAPLDRVPVRNAPGASLAQQPIRRAAAFERAGGQATAQAARRFHSALVDFVREPGPDLLLRLLSHQTRLELAATRREQNLTELRSPGRLTSAFAALPFLTPVLQASAEARVAAGLASAFADFGGHPVSARQLLVGSDPGMPRMHPVVAGLEVRPVTEVLADLLVWLAHHRPDDPRVERGWLPFAIHRLPTHWTDTHAWAGGQLDDRVLHEHLLGFLALDWSHLEPKAPAAQDITAIEPDLAVLQALASGQVIRVGVPVDSAAGRQGLEPDWPARLRAGQVDSVCRAAAALLGRSLVRTGSGSGMTARRYSRVAAPQPDRASTEQHRGVRLLAALAAPASTGALRRVALRADREIVPTTPQGQGVLA